MRGLRFLGLLFLIGSTGLVGRPHAEGPAQAVFHAIAGPGSNIVRDARKVGSTIYAVGSSSPTRSGAPASATLWTVDDTGTSVTLLPDFPNTGASTAGTVSLAIDQSGSFIAGAARLNSGAGQNGQTVFTPTATRVELAGGVPTSSINLNASPYSLFLQRNNGINVPNSSAGAISDAGSVLYGSVQTFMPVTNFLGTGVVSANRSRAVRFDVGTQTSSLIYPINAPADSQTNPVQQNITARGVSPDGSVALGVTQYQFVAGPGSPTQNLYTQGFRYSRTAQGVETVNVLPFAVNPPGSTAGTWNQPIAVLRNNPNVTLLAGNSALYPNGELYFHNNATSIVTSLGSPNVGEAYRVPASLDLLNQATAAWA